jgi:hypothetical protein
MTNLRSLFARTAERAEDQQLLRLIGSLEAEPNQRDPHIRQALEAFTEEARQRGLLEGRQVH